MSAPVPRTSNRRQAGMSLLEMLFSCVIVGVAGAGISGLFMLNTLNAVRMANKTDGLNAARQAIERISKDVRMARHVGDVYTSDADTFPSLTNPLYGTSVTPPTGWPSGPYRVSNRCLVVQVPVFFVPDMSQPPGTWNYWPCAIKADDIAAGVPARPVENVDTLVYLVVDDTARPGEYILQYYCFPGWVAPYFASPIPSYRKYPSEPQTILTGLTSPNIFQYLEKNETEALNGLGDKAPNITDVDNIIGLVVNLQIRREDSGTTAPANVGIKTEVYMRNNPIATTSAQ